MRDVVIIIHRGDRHSEVPYETYYDAVQKVGNRAATEAVKPHNRRKQITFSDIRESGIETWAQQVLDRKPARATPRPHAFPSRILAGNRI